MTRSETTTATNGLPPEDFLKHYRAIKDAHRAKSEAAAAYKAAREAFKADGGDLNALKIVEHLSSLDGADAILRMRETLRYAGWLDLEIGTQSDMFNDTPTIDVMGTVKSEHAAWNAERGGYTAGLAGEPIDNNPHAIATETYVKWRAGYFDGQAALAAKMPKPEED